MDALPKEQSMSPRDRDSIEEALEQIRVLLRGLRYGSVNIIVQDGVVIQIDRMEKRRLRTAPNNGKSIPS